MKIGLSYSRCVRDVVDGKVDIGDILVVISRTDFDPHNDEEWASIWRGYHGLGLSRPEWQNYPPEDEQRFRDVSIALWDNGLFHQPRKFGAHPRRLPYYWLDVTLTTEDLENNPAAKLAWDKFQTLASLGGIDLLDHHE